MPFTSDTAKAARAKVRVGYPPFDRRAWRRAWMAQERARRRALGLCGRCGEHLTKRFLTCLDCRVQSAAAHRRRAAVHRRARVAAVVARWQSSRRRRRNGSSDAG
jgi:predicted amidophosphoribosyltransferase